MPISQKLFDFLRIRQAAYRTVAHREAFTAQEVAEVSHVSGRRLAKVVALRDDDGEWLLAVLPAARRVDLDALAYACGARHLHLAPEAEMLARFPDYEPGAVPPFERLEDVAVYLDDTFAEAHDIYFEDGSHRGLVGMKVQDYIRLARPTIARFSRRLRVGH
jgi:Ala-tRNA(Pro) deacylase